MKKCKLCNINEADKTNSHIVPHFLIKRIINVDNSNGRDKELGFKIGLDDINSFFGKSVLPEKLEEVYGEVTDDLIKNLERITRGELVFENVKDYVDIEEEKAWVSFTFN